MASLECSDFLEQHGCSTIYGTSTPKFCKNDYSVIRACSKETYRNDTKTKILISIFIG